MSASAVGAIELEPVHPSSPQLVLGRIARSGLWSLLAHVFAAGSAFGISVIVGRALGPGALGRYSYYLWILRLVPYLLALGIPAAITKIVAERLGAGEQQKAQGAFRLGLRFHLLLLPVVAALTAWTVWHEGILLALGLAFGTAVVLVSLDLEGLLTALRRFRTLALVAIAAAGVQVVLAGVGLLTGAGWEGFVLFQVAGSVLGLAAMLVACSRWTARRTPKLDSTDRRGFVNFAFVMALALAFDAILWGRPEFWFLDRYRTSQELGLYAAALRLSGLAAVAPLIASRALMPEFSWLRGGQHGGVLKETFPKVCKAIALFAAPLAFGGAAVAGAMLTNIYGSSFSGARLATSILLAGSFVNAALAPGIAAVLTSSRPRIVAEVGAGAVALNLLLDFLLIPRYGMVGAAVANVVIQLVSVSIGLGYAWLRLGLRYPVLMVSRIAFIAVVSAVPAGALAVTAPGWLGLLAAFAAGAFVYAALLFISRTVTLEEMRTLGRLGS